MKGIATMNTSLLALQISLFYASGAEAAAFLPSSRHPPTPDLAKHRGSRREASKPPSPLDASGSSSASEVIEMLPAIAEAPRRRRRHPAFEAANVVSNAMPAPRPELWRRCFPDRPPERRRIFPRLMRDEDERPRGAVAQDASATFVDPVVGARRLLAECGLLTSSEGEGAGASKASFPSPETIMAEEEAARHLASVLSHFQSVATPSDEKKAECVARIVATSGRIGTKCPRWHADHVPVRLVMSLLGRGCEYVREDFAGGDARSRAVNRDALNDLDEEDTARANEVIVPSWGSSPGAASAIERAEEGEAVLLMGRGWEDSVPGDASEEEEGGVGADFAGRGRVLAAVHRSPALGPTEERILLTVDLAEWD
ncbi:hypothetical protein ACHAWF_016281 [Thalassiosira exigua]